MSWRWLFAGVEIAPVVERFKRRDKSTHHDPDALIAARRHEVPGGDGFWIPAGVRTSRCIR
ncbi:uncharacterized protein Dmul_07810 [Desulfococcus multivorans]|nr:uncharacterized protein Dmul_07810 [Desulfococcus multivorans]